MDLLASPSRPESYYQSWFEEHPVVFEALGYEEVLPQPVLRREGQPHLKPDFLCRRPNGLWEVVELKRPDQRIVRANLRYPVFYAPVTRHVSQCRDYTEYFKEQANRTRVAEEHAIDVQADVSAVLVIGQLERDDPRQIAHQLREERNISIFPYDEVCANLQIHRTQMVVHEEGGRGFAVQLVVAIRKMEDLPNLILDVSVAVERDRLTLFVEPEGNLRLRLTDHQGLPHGVSASMQELGVEYDRITLLGLQVGFGDRSSVVTIEVDGVTRVARVFDPIELQVHFDAFIWGSDVDQWGQGSFLLFDTAGWNEILSFADRRSVYQELDIDGKRAIAATGSLPSHFEIIPGACIISVKHPLKSRVRCDAPAFRPGPDHDPSETEQ